MNEAKKADMDAKWKKVVTQAVTSDEFKKKLVDDPLATLKQHGLTVPETVEVKTGTGKTIKLQLPANSPPDLEKEVAWWRWRLDMIQEFGREERPRGPTIVAPETEEGI